MFRAMKLRRLEVISVSDARRLGFVSDVEVNENDGTIAALIVPKGSGIMSRLFHRGEYVIPWRCIIAAGKDLILVRTECLY